MTPLLPLLSDDGELRDGGMEERVRRGAGQDEGQRPPGLPFNGPGKWGLGSARSCHRLASASASPVELAGFFPGLLSGPGQKHAPGCIVWLTRWFREWGAGIPFIVIEKLAATTSATWPIAKGRGRAAARSQSRFLDRRCL